ncbi:hypothetical protein IHE45_17G121400 [Dioscorea alata]|uniref:Uncharacterized protein n=1 Tax=Dioscorea alata TaxID=55571 RepID=A0ACB7UF84_DIOAL|nr:hypothetical protein IHE45_17G121400 [Dioscorea alata]
MDTDSVDDEQSNVDVGNGGEFLTHLEEDVSLHPSSDLCPPKMIEESSQNLQSSLNAGKISAALFLLLCLMGIELINFTLLKSNRRNRSGGCFGRLCLWD